MYRIVTVFMVLIISSACTSPKEKTEKEKKPKTEWITDSRDEAVLLFSEYRLFNNVAGKYMDPNFNTIYEQKIFQDLLDPPHTFGWQWSLIGENKYPFYPEIIFGWNPWLDHSTTTQLPKKISDITAITAGFQKKLTVQGRYNTAFDIWVVSTAKPLETNRTAEIMIWLDNTETTGLPVLDTITINSEAYDFYKGDWDPQVPYLTFIKKIPSWPGQIEIMPFINYLVTNNYISNTHYIASVELGNEIWSGSGRMEISDYSVSVE